MRILILIESKLYLRNYIDTEVFHELASRHDVSFLTQSDLVGELEGRISGAHVNELTKAKGDTLRKYAYLLSYRLKMYEKRKINANFLFRLRRELIPRLYSLIIVPRPYKNSPSAWLDLRLVVSHLRFLAQLTKNTVLSLGFFRYALIVVLVRSSISRLLIEGLWRCVPRDAGLRAVIGKENPDLVIMPTSVVGETTYEITRITQHNHHTKTLMLIDNWDNLSSKSVFIKNPDYVGVMGEQGRRFATALHNIPSSNVAVIGTPRFEVYRQNMHKRPSSIAKKSTTIFDQPYILFAGCAVVFDEIAALSAVSGALSRIRASLPDGTKILYRPHPWGQRNNLGVITADPIPDVVIDPQFRDNKESGIDFQPDLQYYPLLLAKSLMVITPLSTMLLEASIMRKRVLALVHEDGVSLTSPNRMYQNSAHFRGVTGLENLTLINKLSELDSAMLDAYLAGNTPRHPIGLEFFINYEHSDYRNNLNQLVHRVSVDIAGVEK
jgi:hypothetical protein